LTPEKPSDRHMESLTESPLAYLSSTPEFYNGLPGLPLSPQQDDGEDYSFWSNEPKGGFSPIPILQQDSISEKGLEMDRVDKQRIPEFKNDTWSHKDFTINSMDNWHHRVLFPPENLSDQGFTISNRP